MRKASQSSIRFLDFTVTHRSGYFETRPLLKDAGLRRPLTRASAHHSSIHDSWPSARLARINALARPPSVARECAEQFQSMLRVHGVTICPSKVRPSEALFCDRTRSQNSREAAGIRQTNSGRKVFWLTLPFHPWWHRIVARALKRSIRDVALIAQMATVHSSWHNVVVRIAWSNYLPSNRKLLSP